ncbi:MAG TPA: PKD domain-containing protein [Bacteroidia bacterium]|nr:PKD domain-containing protein [Bacteroidia bacterium]
MIRIFSFSSGCRRLCAVAAVVLAAFCVKAQSVANYAVTRTTGITYSSIMSTGVPCNSWRNSATFEEDDNRSNPVDIGFDFWYDGTRYTSLCISTNGYIDFSSTTDNGGPTTGPYGYSNTQFTAPNGTLLALAPFYDDMTTQGATDPLGNSIRTQLSGTAPNRVFTIEWFDMAVYLNTTPSLNFQVKLHETTGIIEFVYGTMNAGTSGFSYTCGINAATMNNTPTTAQLKCQQTANTTTFSNGEQNNLSVMPTSNSKLTFTPPAPANPSGSLTFSGVTQTQMTLNWTNWATNEVGYVIYSSTDNVNWNFETQTAANATSATITGLYSGTTYYWRVYAVTEGWLSNALSGSHATLNGTIYISISSGNWSQGTIWNTGTAPGANDDVIIGNGTTVTTNLANLGCHNLTVGQGAAATLRFGNNNVARTFTVGGNITVNSNATLTVNTSSNTTHTLIVSGNVTNNGTWNMSPDNNSHCNVSFTYATANQAFQGSGTTNNFYNITIDKGSEDTRIFEIKTSTFTAPAGFLTLNNGTFKVSTTGAVSMTPFTATSDIPDHARFWLNSSTATVTTTGGSINLYGELMITAGTMTLGNASDDNLISQGGLFTMNGGTMNIAGRYDRSNTATLSRFIITGGTLTINTVGSTSNTNAPFMMDVIGSQFTQTGGTIIIQRKGGTTGNLGFNCTGGVINSVTGGVLQIGNASTPVSQTITVNTVSPVGAFRVASANATALLATNPLTVINDVELQSGVFNTANLNVNVGGNWNNTGGTYTPGTNTTTFDGTTQTISRTSGTEMFNHISFTGSGTKTLACAINCKNVTIAAGSTFSAGATGFAIGTTGNWSNAGSFSAGTAGVVTFNGTAAQTIGGTAVTVFRDLTIQNSAGVSITANESIKGTLLLNSGTFTTTGHSFTLISDASGTARIGTITGGNITGNITMQRYIYLGPTNWRQVCAPVTGNTLQGWNDNIITAGFPGSDYPNMNGWYSIGTYDETVAGPKENGYSPPSNITDALTAKRGYYVYIGPLPVTLDVTGPPVKMNQTFTLTYTPSAGPTQDGWNMLGNPYPSSIDWDAAGFVRTNTDNVLYVWNPSLNQYATYVGGVGVNGGSRYIPSSQAFWVRAIAAGPSVSINEASKAGQDQPFMRMGPAEYAQQQSSNQLLGLTLSGANGTDETVIRFNAAATDSFDVNLDAYKFGSMDTTAPYFASVIPSQEDLAVNSLPDVTTNISIPLRVRTGASGTYTIARDSMTNVPNSMCVTLEDLYNGTVTPFPAGATYSFFLSDTTRAPRFLLHFGPSLETGSIASLCMSSNDGKAFARGTGNGPWDYTWKDASGNVIATHNNISGTDTLFGAGAGVYTVEVNGNDGFCTFRSDTVRVDAPQAIVAYGSIYAPSCSYTNDGRLYVNSVSGGTAPYTHYWNASNTTDSLVNIPQGNYYLHVTDANGCADSTLFTLLPLSQLNAAFVAMPDTITPLSPVSFSNYTSGGTNYSWNFGDGSPADATPDPYYSYGAPGSYTVVLVAEDSLCSDTAMSLVYVMDNTGIATHGQSSDVSFAAGNSSIGVIFHLPETESALIDVYDASGKLIAEVKQDQFDGRVDIPVPGIATGMYSVIVTLPGRTVAGKVIFRK